MNVFDTLNSLNVNEHTEKKATDGGRTMLTYLSWPWAWAEVKKRYQDAHYTVAKDENGLPYFADDRTGIMVYTTVTIDGITHEMWLPVMDGNNKAMRFEPYEIAGKYKTTTVKAATMFDINKTIMRCLTKNLAMFGLGLYIYAGEDLPEGETPDDALKPGEKVDLPKAGSWNARVARSAWCTENGISQKDFASIQATITNQRNIIYPNFDDITEEQFRELCSAVKEMIPDYKKWVAANEGAK